MKKTPWFSALHEPPVRAGWYECRNAPDATDHALRAMRHWNGRNWSTTFSERVRTTFGQFAGNQWRGPMTYIHINAPAPVEVGCIVIRCPTCERDRRALFKHYEWYGATVICAGCGDGWQDGEMMERPFAPGWRRKSIEHARRELAKVGIQA